MTYQRISALADIISRYKNYKDKNPADSVVVVISFDLLHELRMKCVKSSFTTDRGSESFMGCKIIMSHAKNYIAVAYLNELDDQYHSIVEITDEEATT